MDEWIKTTVGGLGELFDGPHATPKRRSEGPYFLNISSLKSGRLDLAESDHVSPEDYAKWTRRVTPEPGDLLFSYETRLGDAALMPEGIEACLGRRMALLRPDRTVVDPGFLLYFYLSPKFQRIIATHTIHGATVERIGLATMPSWAVELPPIVEQRAIAEVLGALDDKIAANDRTLGLLDAVVRATYEALDGEPRRIDTIAFNVREQVSPTVLAPSMPYLGLEHLPRRRMWVTERGHAQDVTSAKTAFEPGDALFGKLRPYFHKVVAAQARGVCSTDILVVRANEAELRGFLLAAVSSDEVVRRCTAASEGTRMPRTSWKVLGAATFPWPGELPARRFSGQVSAQAALAAKLAHESQVLSATRDELLPLLMSGKVRVKDAEKVVEDVV